MHFYRPEKAHVVICDGRSFQTDVCASGRTLMGQQRSFLYRKRAYFSIFSSKYLPTSKTYWLRVFSGEASWWAKVFKCVKPGGHVGQKTRYGRSKLKCMLALQILDPCESWLPVGGQTIFFISLACCQLLLTARVHTDK